MELINQSQFLILSCQSPQGQYRVRLCESVADALTYWDSSTRISPLWPIKGYAEDRPSAKSFEGAQWLIFLGPVQPALVEDSCPSIKANASSNQIWVGVGAFNVVLSTPSETCLKEVLTWAKSACPFEVWHVVDGGVTFTEAAPQPAPDAEWRRSLASLLRSRPSLHPVIEEYGALMAASLSRGTQVTPSILTDLLKIHQALTEWINEGSDAEIYPILVNVNAGLSRFSSQAYSGITPILSTESHYWTHSLLGTGTANLALRNLTAFILERLAKQRLPGRFAALANKRDNVPFLPQDNRPELFEKDHLADATPSDPDEPVIPHITYFSGRDGFKYKDVTLSAPLGTIAACNSLRWSLLTLTHEISHSFIAGILDSLLPDIASQEEITRASDLANRGGAPDNWLEAVQQFFLRSLVILSAEADVGNHKRTGNYTVDPKTLPPVLDKFRHEIEEIMVHAFDYLYFYRRDAEKYVRSVWVSWSVIPNISHKVPEYAIRTLCAVLSIYLHKGSEANNIVKSEVLRGLKSIKADDVVNGYVAEAIHYIENKWEEVSKALDARKPFVRIVRGFVYSETAASVLMRETIAGGSRTGKGGYRIAQGEMTQDIIDNPLLFLETFTENENAKESHSVWMLNVLAHCLREETA